MIEGKEGKDSKKTGKSSREAAITCWKKRKERIEKKERLRTVKEKWSWTGEFVLLLEMEKPKRLTGGMEKNDN